MNVIMKNRGHEFLKKSKKKYVGGFKKEKKKEK